MAGPERARCDARYGTEYPGHVYWGTLFCRIFLEDNWRSQLRVTPASCAGLLDGVARVGYTQVIRSYDFECS
jgi:hypothetical protein